jgi:hypothetical protein
MIEHAMLHAKSGAREQLPVTPASSRHRSRPQDLMARLAPHVLSLHAEQVEVKSLNRESSFHYHLLLHTIDARVKLGQRSGVAKVSNLRIYTPQHEMLYLKLLTADVRMSDEQVIAASLTADTIDAIYSHEDIYGWFLKIFTAGMKSSRKEMILRGIELGNQKVIQFYHSPFVRDLFAQIVLNGCVELRNAALVLELDDQISSVNAGKIRLQVSQSEKRRQESYDDYTMNLLFKDRHWSVDVVSESSLCWFMGSRQPVKCEFVRGCALYLENALVRVGSGQNENAFRVNLRVNTLRTEYSSKLTQFTVQSARSFKAFVNLFKQLKKKRIEDQPAPKITLKDLLTRIAVNLKITDCSCLFINRHEVCTFVTFSEVLSTDNLNYRLDTLAVSTIDLRKFSLADIADCSTTYISTCLLKVKLEMAEQPQLCVDFAEKLECSWNAHFLRHSLSLVRDFRRFRQNIEDALEMAKPSKQLLALPSSLPLGFDIKKLRNIRVKHADVNVDKLILLINELSGENLFFYNYFH